MVEKAPLPERASPTNGKDHADTDLGSVVTVRRRAVGERANKNLRKAELRETRLNSSAEAGDVAGHMVVLTKANCTWPTAMEIEGVKTKSAIDVSVAEVTGNSGTNHGYSTSMDKVTR